MTLERPVPAPEAADGATAPAVALHVALETAVHGGLAQTSPPILALSGRMAGHDYLPGGPLAPGLLIIPWAVQAQSDPTDLTRPIADGLIALEWDVSARNAAGGPDPDGKHHRNLRRRRPDQPGLPLRVGVRRHLHRRCDEFHLHAPVNRQRQGHHGAGHIHGRRGLRRVAIGDSSVDLVGDPLPPVEITATPDSNSQATGEPTISGTPQVGQTLTASTSGISDDDGLTNVSYSYQWLADDTDIDGATNSTYTLQSSDNGKVIKVI